MNAYYKTLLSLLSIALLSVFSQGRSLASDSGISAEDIARIDDARDIYQSSCAACHGFDGAPIMAGVPSFANGERLEKGDSELLASIENGKIPEAGGIAMPPWKESLSEDEMESALRYIRVINGDPVFQDNCLSCHDESVPPVADSVPKTLKKLNEHQGPFNLCKGTDTDSEMERQDIVSVIQFLVGVSGE